jgi:hypothetical protein
MSRRTAFYHWQAQVVKTFADAHVLSRPQAPVLALFSFGIVQAGCCALNRVAEKLAPGDRHNTVLQRLKYWLRNGADQQHPREAQVNVRAVFPLLVAWVLTLWQGDQLMLALDATTLHDDLIVLAIALLYRGTAIPLAWAILPAQRKRAWRPLILDLRELVAQAIPARYEVVLLADRGWYSACLYRAMRRYHWHPLLRVNPQAHFCPVQQDWRPTADLLTQAGQQWRGPGRFSKSQPLDCTVLAFWAVGQQRAWFLVTDLGPPQAQAAWYGLRVWIEEGFRILKSMGWQWQASRITAAERAERLWLALAVATVGMLVYGTWAEDKRVGPPAPTGVHLTEPAPPARTEEAAAVLPAVEAVGAYASPTRSRQNSLFHQGQTRFAQACEGQRRFLRHWRLVPEPWPEGGKNA